MTTTTFAAGTVIASSWLNDVDAAVYERLPVIGIHINQFSPTADGVTDDLTPLTNFFNSAIANPGVPHYLGNETYACSAALPTINVSGVRIYGSGPTTVYDVGTAQCTVIKKIGTAGTTMLTIAPPTGASAQRLEAIVLEGVSFNGGQLAAKALVIQSVRNSKFDVYAEECTTANIELGVVSTLGEARDLQACRFRISGRNIYTTAPILTLGGDTGANVSLNIFEVLDVSHKDGTAIIHSGTDNNIFDLCRVYRNTGGTATYSIEWRGGATDPEATRNETYHQLTTTVAAVAKGTGTYTVAAHDIFIQTLDLGNGTPTPVAETGAVVAGCWLAWTPTITAGSGTITTSSAVARYKIDPIDQNMVDIQLAITITTNGTGATNLQATLPVVADNNQVYGILTGKEIAATGTTCTGHIAVDTSTVIIHRYDGTYPAANGYVVTMTGRYRRKGL